MQEFFDFITRFVSRPDKVLLSFIELYGYWVYAFLFLIIFAETGLIVASFIMPFLPGDALIFAIGMISANDQQNHLHIEIIIPLLMLAAMIGDNVNYYVGRKFGNWLLEHPGKFYLQPKHIRLAAIFFHNKGKKAIIIARFIPLVRTIMPFICGTTRLKYRIFILYSFIGAVLWVGVLSLIGYFLGGFSLVKNNLEFFILGIILVANLPLISRFIKKKFQKKHKRIK